MELLKEIFDLKLTKEFIAICESVAIQNPNFINNGIGVNYSENSIESIKLYYGFHHVISAQDSAKLHLFGNSAAFDHLIKTLTPKDYEWHAYLPTGVSFALKFDKNLTPALGHFLMPKLNQDDLFFKLPKVIQHYSRHSILPVEERKGIFTLINEKGEEHFKDYYYVKHDFLKKEIGKDFGVDLSIVPSIEWVLGKGYYDQSSPNDEKIVLQSNYKEVYEKITKNEPWEIVNIFNQFMLKNFNAYCVCPGYYKNKNIKSYYYFNASLPTFTHVNTIPLIQSKLNHL